jgi:MoaA/NifB/PqqE/SkfB family radical SAM enzyme
MKKFNSFNQYPKNIQIALTTRCNKNCYICQRDATYGAGGGSDVPVENIFKLKDAIANAHVINLTGFGETFFHKNFSEILDFVFKHNDRKNLLNFVTNGSLLSEKWGQRLKGRLNSMVISLNAATEETYKRDVGGSLNKAIHRIKIFMAALGKESADRITLHYVVYKSNMDELAEFVRIAKNNGTKRVHFDHYQVSHEKDVGESLFFVQDEYNRQLSEAKAIGRDLGIIVVGKKFFEETFSENRDAFKCPIPFSDVYVESNGDLIPCCYAPHDSMGNTYTDDFDFNGIWFGKDYQEFRDNRGLEACQKCNWTASFDDSIVHCIPGLRTHERVRQSFNKYEKSKEYERNKQKEEFWKKTGIDFNLYEFPQKDFDLDYNNTVEEWLKNPGSNLEKKANELYQDNFLLQDFSDGQNNTIYLDNFFYGTGWGKGQSDANGDAWRWIHPSKNAVVYTKLESGKDYLAKVEVHSSADFFIEINDTMATKIQGWVKENDRTIHQCLIPEKTINAWGGFVKLVFKHQQKQEINGSDQPSSIGNEMLRLSFPKVEFEELPLDAASRQDIITRFLSTETKNDLFDEIDNKLYETALQSFQKMPGFDEYISLYNSLMLSQEDEFWKTLALLDSTYEQIVRNTKTAAADHISIEINEPFFGTGWGITEGDIHGTNWRWIGPTGQSQLFVRLESGKNYLLSCLIHAAKGESQNQMVIETNGFPIYEQKVVLENSSAFQTGIIPKEFIPKKGWVKIEFRITNPGVDVSYLNRTFKNQFAFGKIVIQPSVEETDIADQQNELFISKGLDHTLYAYGENYFEENSNGEKSTQFFKYSYKQLSHEFWEGINKHDKLFEQTIRKMDLPTVDNLNLALKDSFLGTGWGIAEEDVHGTSWRWIGPHGKSVIYAKLKKGNDYFIKCLVHTSNGDSQDKFKILVNEQTVYNPLFVLEEEKNVFYHCFIPADILDQTNGLAKISFQIFHSYNQNSEKPDSGVEEAMDEHSAPPAPVENSKLFSLSRLLIKNLNFAPDIKVDIARRFFSAERTSELFEEIDSDLYAFAFNSFKELSNSGNFLNCCFYLAIYRGDKFWKTMDVLNDSYSTTIKSLNSPEMSRVDINLNVSFYGTGWGKSEEDIHGANWRWIGPTGKSELYVRLVPKEDYYLKCLIHAAKANSQEHMIVSINGIPANDQKVIAENSNMFFGCKIPKDVIESNGWTKIEFRIDDSGKEVTFTKQAYKNQFAFGKISIFPNIDVLVKTSELFDSFILKGLDYRLYQFGKKYAVEKHTGDKFVSLLNHIYKQQDKDFWESIDQFEDIFDQMVPNLDLPFTESLDLELKQLFLGFGWGIAEEDIHGTSWRWIGPQGRSVLYLRLKPGSDYLVKCLIHTAKGDSQEHFKIIFNEQEVSDTSFVLEDNKHVYYNCTIPAQTIKKSNGHVKVSFQIDDSNSAKITKPKSEIKEPKQFSLCRVLINPILGDQS